MAGRGSGGGGSRGGAGGDRPFWNRETFLENVGSRRDEAWVAPMADRFQAADEEEQRQLARQKELIELARSKLDVMTRGHRFR
jgi:hypothetical protein